MPLRPMKPIEMRPGPDHYFFEGQGGANNLIDKCYPIDDAKEFAQAERTMAIGGVEPNAGVGVPGPAFYTSIKEPKKISFLFNPAEKWVS